MGALFAWLAGAVTGFKSLAILFMGRKAAFAALYIAAYIAMVVALSAAINGALAAAAATVPASSLLYAGLSLVPSNAAFLISQIGTAYAASWLYMFHVKVLKLKVHA